MVIARVAEAIGEASHSIVGEHFAFTDPGVVGAARDAAERGVSGTMLADAEMLGLGRFETPPQFHVSPHGTEAWKVHTKLTTIDADHSLLSTSGLTREHSAKPQLDFLVEANPPDSALLDELTRAGASGDRDRIVAAADAAAEAGYLLNDPANGVLHLRNGIKGLADATTGDAYIATKVLNEHKVVRRFAEAADAAGGSLRIDATGGTQRWKPAKAAAEEVGANVKRIDDDPTGIGLHGNVVVAQTADGPRMIIMTAPFTHRGLGQNGAPRLGREIGVMVDDPTQIRTVLDRLAQLDGSRAAKVAAALFD
ncbi:MAG: hypothetical protein JWM98_1594 [Thermoleophilia bacterium]|nr:hypothetical protein [Thermoleophilia bacterium]